MFEAVFKPSVVVISIGVNKRLRRFELLNGVGPSLLRSLTRGRQLFLQHLFLTVRRLQLLPHLLQLNIQRTEGLLVLPLLIHQIGVMLPNPDDDVLLGNTLVLECLNTYQGL